MIDIKLGDVALNAIMKILEIICDENYIKYKVVFSGDVILFLLRQFYFCKTKVKNKLFATEIYCSKFHTVYFFIMG